ncbi:MAG: GntR family transcriptional regulator [Actinomycetales bacterium]
MPLYERIERQLRRRLDQATEGDLFPSEPALATEFGVARMTIRAAMNRIERDGLVERVPGRGTYVRKPASQRGVSTLLSFHDQALAEGRTPRSRTVAATTRRATPVEKAALGLDEPAASVVAITRVRLLDDVPIAIEYAVFPGHLDDLLETDLETASLHQELRRRGHEPTLGSSVITATTADADATVLGVDPATAILVETRTITDQNHRPLEHTISRYVAERYALRVDFTVVSAATHG